MSLTFRRLFYLAAIIIFLIIAPILILYTTGYRYDFHTHKIILTGSFFIETIPQDTDIYLNNENMPDYLKGKILVPRL